MKLLSIQVGQPQELNYRGKPITTGIFKTPVQGPLHVGKFNIEGDLQADLRVHGGRDKAVYAYSFQAYDWWKNIRSDLKFEFGAFGENLTFDNIDEETIYVGDRFEIGQAILLATQPRLPCFKLGIKFNDASVIKTFMQSKRPGIYFQVVKEGIIQAGDQLKLIEQEPVLVSISELFGLITNPKLNRERLLEILQVKFLPDYWRNEIQSLI